jgi:ketosteroid isomerase-like protein
LHAAGDVIRPQKESVMQKSLAVLLTAVIFGPSAQAGDLDAVAAPIRQLFDGFNHGDTKSVLAAYAEGDITIIDEIAPYRWRGRGAPQSWATDYQAQARAKGIEGGTVTYGEPSRIEIDGRRAYVVVPTSSVYTMRGQPIREEAQVTFVLRDGTRGWKISSWTWTGVPPHPAP